MQTLEQFNFQHVGSTLNDNAIAALEDELGGALQPEYRQFLLANNGGVPSPCLVSSLPQIPYDIQVFFSVKDGHAGLRAAVADCREILEEAQNSLPTPLVPIAADSGERYLCIAISGPSSEVFACSLDRDDPTPVRPLHITFREFVDSLSQPEEPELPMERLAQLGWKAVREHIAKGGPVVDTNGGLSLLCQAIRCDNYELFAELIELGIEPDLEEAVEVAVVNNRLSMLKLLIENGGDAREALDFAVGPTRQEMREYLHSLLA